MGRVQGGIDPSIPVIAVSVLNRRQFEFQRFPKGVEDKVDEALFFAKFNGKRNAVRILAPVRLVERDAVPRLIRLQDQLVQTHPLLLMFNVAQKPTCVEQCHEPMDIRMFRNQRPIEPIRFVVQAVRIVVAVLCAAHLITHQNHGHAHGKQRHGQKVLHLPVP